MFSTRPESSECRCQKPGASDVTRLTSLFSARLVRQVAYARALPAASSTASSHACSRSRQRWRSAQTRAGFSGERARNSFCNKLVQSSPRSRWAISCRMICFMSFGASSLHSERGTTTTGRKNPITLGASTASDRRISTERLPLRVTTGRISSSSASKGTGTEFRSNAFICRPLKNKRPSENREANAQTASRAKAQATFRWRENVCGGGEGSPGSAPNKLRPSAKQGSKATSRKTIIHNVKRVEARNPEASLSAAQATAVNNNPCQMLAISSSAGPVEMKCPNKIASMDYLLRLVDCIL